MGFAGSRSPVISWIFPRPAGPRHGSPRQPPASHPGASKSGVGEPGPAWIAAIHRCGLLRGSLALPGRAASTFQGQHTMMTIHPPRRKRVSENASWHDLRSRPGRGLESHSRHTDRENRPQQACCGNLSQAATPADRGSPHTTSCAGRPAVDARTGSGGPRPTQVASGSAARMVNFHRSCALNSRILRRFRDVSRTVPPSSTGGERGPEHRHPLIGKAVFPDLGWPALGFRHADVDHSPIGGQCPRPAVRR